MGFCYCSGGLMVTSNIIIFIDVYFRLKIRYVAIKYQSFFETDTIKWTDTKMSILPSLLKWLLYGV